MRLLSVLKNKPICNEFHFILFGLLLFIISIKHYFIFLIFLIYIIFIFKKIKRLLILIIFICLIFFISYYLNNKEKEYVKEYNGVFIVQDIKDNYYLLKGDYNLLIYKRNESLNIGDEIEANVHLYEWDSKSYKHEFDYKEYYKSIGIDYRGYINSYVCIGKKNTLSLFRNKILKFYDLYLKDKSFTYFKALIFGINDIEDDVSNAYSALYISHILAISGMHLIFIYNIILKLSRILFKIDGSLLSIVIISFYLLLINFPIAALRAYLFLILGFLNQKGNIKYTKLDIFSISFIIMSIINPLACYQNSFILSYLVSFLLIFINDIINVKSKLLNVFFISVLSIIITFPFIVNMSNNIAILNIIISPFINIVVSAFLLPLTFLLIILPFLPIEFLYIFLDSYLINISNIFDSINFPSFDFYEIIIYYILFAFMILNFKKSKKYICIFVSFVFLIFIINTTSPYYKVTFIDVGQGDSTVIELPYRKGVILIDSFNNNVDYLKSVGINKIDIIILTHNDIDHIGSIEEVKEEFKVDKIYTSYYEEGLSFKTIPIKAGYTINFHDINIDVLAPINKYDDSNSNSIMLRFEINGYGFLFTGDASVETENDVIKKYKNRLKSDILKVGHHGSITSSSLDFLEVVKPKVSIISVGKNNKYGLPDEKVISRLQRFGNVYKTSDCGNISIIIKKNEFEVSPYK